MCLEQRADLWTSTVGCNRENADSNSFLSPKTGSGGDQHVLTSFLFLFFSRRLWTNTTTTSTLTEQYSREREREREREGEREYGILSSSPTMPEQMKSACLPESSGLRSSSAWASGMLYAAVFVQEERGCWLTGAFQRASSRKTGRMEPRDTVPCSQKTVWLQLVVILMFLRRWHYTYIWKTFPLSSPTKPWNRYRLLSEKTLKNARSSVLHLIYIMRGCIVYRQVLLSSAVQDILTFCPHTLHLKVFHSQSNKVDLTHLWWGRNTHTHFILRFFYVEWEGDTRMTTLKGDTWQVLISYPWNWSLSI